MTSWLAFPLSALLVSTQGLRSRPLRTLLACFSLVIGVLSVVSVTASSDVAEQALLAQEQRKNGLAPTYKAAASWGNAQLADIPRIITSASAATQHATAAYAAIDARTIQSDGPMATTIVAYTGDLRSIYPYTLDQGTWVAPENSSLRPLVMVNKHSQQSLNSPTIGIETGDGGATLQATIAGHVSDGQDEPRLYIPYDSATKWFPELVRSSRITFVTHPTTNTAGTAKPLVTQLATTAGFQDVTFSRADSTDSLAAESATVRNIFVGIATIALIVGAVGVLNIGLATVGERVEEFALRRALGSRKTHLQLIVLLESATIGLFSAAAALAIAVPILGPATTLLFPQQAQLNLDSDFPLAAAAIGIGASFIAALCGGIIPAVRAARIEIAHVMRA